MPTHRPPLAVLAALACATALVACTPAPVDAGGGRVVAIENLSAFVSVVTAGMGDCQEQVEQAPDADDTLCAAEVLGEARSARIDANALLSFEHDGPDDGLSAILFSSRVESNRSATGLASAGTVHRVLVRFDVEDEPVAWTASAGLTCRDYFYDYLRLRGTDVPFTAFDAGAVFLDGCQGFESMEEIDLFETGTLPVGSYEIRVFPETLDRFTEEVDFTLRFGE